MVGGDKQEALLFELGDIARDRLAARASGLPSFEQVMKAEDALTQRRAEVTKIEAGKNQAEDAFLHFVEEVQGERTKAEPLLSKWQRQISAAEARSQETRQNLTGKRQEVRRLRMSGADKAALAKAEQESAQLERLLDSALIPSPGEPGEEALRVHRRLLDLEDEVAHRKAEKDKAVEVLEQRLIQKKEEVRRAEDVLEQALLRLGQEVYAQRISDPALDPLYSRLDRD